jgi:HPt (histidine-containing phosphotransfer) domain-containing protein
MPERLDELAAAAGQDQFHQLRRHAHELIGAAGNLGADDLAQHCSRLQDAARARDHDAAEAAVNLIQAESRHVNQVLTGL